MQEMINRCIAKVKEESEINERGGYDVQAPENPSIIVNYNLDNKMAERYFDYLEQLWPSVCQNVPQAKAEDDFEEIENDVRGNQIFKNFSEIDIHILVNLTACEIQELNNFLKHNFSRPVYKVILHEFLDYECGEKIPATEKKLLEILGHHERIRYQFLYSNRLSNGGMWRAENASRLLRLAANITAIMSIDSHYFNSGTIYTFAYNLLEKPTKKIVQFTIHRMLERMLSYSDEQNLDQDLIKIFQDNIKRVVGYKAAGYLFTESDFKYLPSNKNLHKEKANVSKSIFTLERNYPIAASCYHAMTKVRTDEIREIQLNGLDFTKEIDQKLSYYKINGFLSNNRQKEDLPKRLEDSLLHQKTEQDNGAFGTYGKVLAAYGNQMVEQAVTKRVFEQFEKQLLDKIDSAININEWLSDFEKSGELQINAVENETNLINYYGKIIDDFWNSNRNVIIARLDQCCTREELLWKGVFPTVLDLFKRTPIYYKSFEDEIDERVGNETARTMFQRISQDDEINTVCLDLTNLQSSIKTLRTNVVVLLINPKSKLMRVNMNDNYEILKLNKQDCIERIDFHIVSLIQEGKNGN